MLAAMALAATFADCVPMRAISASPESLGLLKGTPVTCLLVDETQWTSAFIDAAHKQGLRILAAARTKESADRAALTKSDAIVLEGKVEWSGAKPTIQLPLRRDLKLEANSEVTGTTQGVWPGLELEHSGPKTTAAPTGGVWINTNTGFLRYIRSAYRGVFWVANRPPANAELTASRYMQAIADAAATGSRWIIALDNAFAKRLLESDESALKDWKQIMDTLSFYEKHKEWRKLKPWAQVAIVQDVATGAWISGNLLDMLSVMNTPVRAVPTRELTSAYLEGAKVTVTVQPQSYTPQQMELIDRFAEKGGKVVSGPKNWKMPEPEGERITFDKSQYKQLEAIWPELHMAVQRKNLGVRMFNVTGSISYLLQSADGKQAVLQLVNFTDYPVESITAFVQGKYKTATFYSPNAEPRKLSIYDAPEGTGVEIDKLGVCGAVVLE